MWLYMYRFARYGRPIRSASIASPVDWSAVEDLGTDSHLRRGSRCGLSNEIKTPQSLTPTLQLSVETHRGCTIGAIMTFLWTSALGLPCWSMIIIVHGGVKRWFPD